MCVAQCVASTDALFWLRLDNYKACYSRFRLRSSVPQMGIFRHFSEEVFHGLVEEIYVAEIDKPIWRDRRHESFWQHKLDTFIPQGLNVKEVDAEYYYLFELACLFYIYSLFILHHKQPFV